KVKGHQVRGSGAQYPVPSRCSLDGAASAPGPGVVLVDNLLRDTPAVGDLLARLLRPLTDGPVLLTVGSRAAASTRRAPANDDAATANPGSRSHVRREYV